MHSTSVVSICMSESSMFSCSCRRWAMRGWMRFSLGIRRLSLHALHPPRSYVLWRAVGGQGGWWPSLGMVSMMLLPSGEPTLVTICTCKHTHTQMSVTPKIWRLLVNVALIHSYKICYICNSCTWLFAISLLLYMLLLFSSLCCLNSFILKSG